MAKYVTKENLPQFKYYNFCDGIHNRWSFDPCDVSYKVDDLMDMTLSYEDGEINIDKFFNIRHEFLSEGLDKEKFVALFKTEILDKFEDKSSDTAKLYNLIVCTLKAMIKDERYLKEWLERLDSTLNHGVDKAKNAVTQMLLILSMFDEYLTFASRLRAAQGFPLKYKDDDSYSYPKMLLIEEGLYTKYKNDPDPKLDYDFIKESLSWETYVMTINGESPEKRMVFTMVPSIDGIELCMLDPKNGLSCFHIVRDDDKLAAEAVEEHNLACSSKPIVSNGSAFIVGDAWACHPRGDYWCNGKQNYCYLWNGECSCIHKSLRIVAAVVRCFQEYQRKVLERPANLLQVPKNSKSSGRVERYVPDDMIRTYDVSLSQSNFERFNKFALYSAGSSHTSTEKSPHVRKGTMRFNPKTGQKDIPVRGCVVHREKYAGFTSAERVKE